jgi:hypothetical protein
MVLALAEVFGLLQQVVGNLLRQTGLELMDGPKVPIRRTGCAHPSTGLSEAVSGLVSGFLGQKPNSVLSPGPKFVSRHYHGCASLIAPENFAENCQPNRILIIE